MILELTAGNTKYVSRIPALMKGAWLLSVALAMPRPTAETRDRFRDRYRKGFGDCECDGSHHFGQMEQKRKSGLFWRHVKMTWPIARRSARAMGASVAKRSRSKKFVFGYTHSTLNWSKRSMLACGCADCKRWA